MPTKTQKTIAFSLIKTIMVIMQVDILTRMYENKFKIDFNMVITKLKFNLLTDEVKDFIKGTFDDLIVGNEEYTKIYSSVDVHPALKEFDIKARKVVPRRLTVEYLEDKKADGTLTENERMVLYSIRLKQLSTRIHNMGKHGKCTDEEARDIIGAVQTMFTKSKSTLEKYGRKGEWNFEE